MEAEMIDAGEMVSDLPDRKGLVRKTEVKIVQTHVKEDLRLPGYQNRIDTDKLRPMFCVFQEFYSMAGKIGQSKLAEVNEEHYRVLTQSDVLKQKGDNDYISPELKSVDLGRQVQQYGQ